MSNGWSNDGHYSGYWTQTYNGTGHNNSGHLLVKWMHCSVNWNKTLMQEEEATLIVSSASTIYRQLELQTYRYHKTVSDFKFKKSFPVRHNNIFFHIICIIMGIGLLRGNLIELDFPFSAEVFIMYQ